MIEYPGHFAEISLPLPIKTNFHYSIPESLKDSVKKGIRVEVPFAKKTVIGYVINVSNTSPVREVRQIKGVIDTDAVVDDNALSIARWMSKRYFCSFGEALAAFMPASLKPPKRKKEKAGIKKQDLNISLKPSLNESQRNAILEINKSIHSNEHSVFLLHGVTGSGKTEVYLSAIEESLSKGKSAIYLLPEISLTPQFISIVKGRFPGIVDVWHSRISQGQRYSIWENARKGITKIILGARSCIFAPFDNLGLIVIDEEHEPTYKQDQKPSYHVREVAIERAKKSNASIILGSATPSIESYYKAVNNEYKLISMPERIDSKTMPEVVIIDLSQIWGENKIVSAQLKDALTGVLARREQAIIFLNRRGFSPSVSCHACGKVWECPKCSISLVYHKYPEGLRCHYCGYKENWPGECPHCKGHNISVFGVGTQKVEDELKILFPQARIARLDRDTTSKKGVYKTVYDEFKNENFDILIGTQMVAKGFDFQRVTFVGVIDADTALHLPDFRAPERTFQLITQVAGRSGRGSLKGRVIVQSKHPEHYALLAAKSHNYKLFYDTEIKYRNEMFYPPFSSLVNIMIRGRYENKVIDSINDIEKEIIAYSKTKNERLEILGPTPASRARIKNLYRWQILLKGELSHLLELIQYITDFPVFSGVLMSVDVDPYDIL